MSLLPFVRESQIIFKNEKDNTVTWPSYIRLVLSVTADLSLISWVMVFVGMKTQNPYIASIMIFGVPLLSTIVFLLSIAEFDKLLRRESSWLKRSISFLFAFTFWLLISIIPVIYGLGANGFELKA